MKEVVCQGIVFRKCGDHVDVLLCQRGEAARNEIGKWCIPGGHLEENESYKECVTREVKEETNIDIKPENWQMVSQDYPKGPDSMLCVNFATVLDASFAEQIASNVNVPDEISSVMFVDINNITTIDLAFNKENIIELIRSAYYPIDNN